MCKKFGWFYLWKKRVLSSACLVLLAYILGIKMGLGINGCFLGIAADEVTRGAVMFFRWKSRRWMAKALV